MKFFHDVPFEFHVYPKGRHRLGFKTDYQWEDSILRWLGELLDE
jgi:hypothetical protein